MAESGHKTCSFWNRFVPIAEWGRKSCIPLTESEWIQSRSDSTEQKNVLHENRRSRLEWAACRLRPLPHHGMYMHEYSVYLLRKAKQTNLNNPSLFYSNIVNKGMPMRAKNTQQPVPADTSMRYRPSKVDAMPTVRDQAQARLTALICAKTISICTVR